MVAAAFFKDMACYEMPHKLQIDFQFICSSIYQNSIPLGIIYVMIFRFCVAHIFNNINATINAKKEQKTLDMFHYSSKKIIFKKYFAIMYMFKTFFCVITT